MKLLFICTHNRCRSILGEVVTNSISKQIDVQSAGSQPAGFVHPLTIKNLLRKGYKTNNLTSKSWDDLEEFIPDVVITVCDNASKEQCPVWLGDAIRVHWGLPDPTMNESDETQIEIMFDEVITVLKKRIEFIDTHDLDGCSKDELTLILQQAGEIE
jgi:arsenate reductase